MKESHRMDDVIKTIQQSKNIVFFTGAGISADSGVGVFRGKGGLWDEFSDGGFTTWEGIRKSINGNPKGLLKFLLAFIKPMVFAEPNDAHIAISQLQKTKDVTVITQNIDGLHSIAGSKLVLELHGSIYETIREYDKRIEKISKRELIDIISQRCPVRDLRIGIK